MTETVAVANWRKGISIMQGKKEIRMTPAQARGVVEMLKTALIARGENGSEALALDPVPWLDPQKSYPWDRTAFFDDGRSFQPRLEFEQDQTKYALKVEGSAQ